MEPHLSTLVPYLIQTLNDTKVSHLQVVQDIRVLTSPKPLVRSITCWTLGRYASWCTQPVSDDHKNRFFVPTLEGVSRMLRMVVQVLMPRLASSHGPRQ